MGGEKRRWGEGERQRPTCLFSRVKEIRSELSLSLKGTSAHAYSLAAACPVQRVDTLCQVAKGHSQGVPGY